jgi:ankyrin repeat protein
MSGNRIIHQAVIMDDEFLIDYLINNDGNLYSYLAHLMARDYNGYTPLLKAAALGRLNIVKKLIYAGVPINHKDPWGNTPLDKVELSKSTG